MRRAVTFLFCLAVLQAGCSLDAPRDNPLDPGLGGNIDGRVLTRRADGIAGAVVIISGSGRYCATDSAGRFSFRGLPAETVRAVFAADGYEPDSVELELVKGRVEIVDRYLNGRPLLAGSRVSSHVWNRGWPPDPLVFFRLTTDADDPDGPTDIDSVWCTIPTLGLTLRLAYNPDSDDFRRRLGNEELPDRNPESVIGQDIHFHVADLNGASTSGPAHRVSRLIYDSPAPAFPSGGLDSLARDTTFYWRVFDSGYPVNYYGQIVRIEGGSPAGVLLDFDRPGSYDTTWRFVRDAIPAGEYYWTIEAFDEFGNSARSAEQRFHVN